MPSPPIRVLLVGQDPLDAGSVRAMLAAADRLSFQVEHAGTLLAALDSLAEGRADLILLDLVLPDSQGIETLMAVRMHAPQVPILVWTSLDNPHLAATAVQAGAQDYLIKERLTPAALIRIVEFTMLRRGSQPAPAPVPVSCSIGLAGAKGGVGVTTVACHLALELRRITAEKVLLADLDLQGGQVALLMKADSPYSVLDAARNLHRLDKDYWAALVTDAAGGVSVIRAPGLGDAEAATDRFRHLFRFLKSQYRWILTDLGRAGNFSLDVAMDANHLLLVSTAEIQQLYGTRQILARLEATGFPRERLRLVLNRFTGRMPLSRAEVEKILGVPVYAVLPNNYGALCEAYSSGTLLPETVDLRRQIAALAARLAGVDPAPPRKRASLLGFLKRGAQPVPEPSATW